MLFNGTFVDYAGWDEGLAAPYQGFPPVMALSS